MGRSTVWGRRPGGDDDLELDDGRAGEPVQFELRKRGRAPQELDAIDRPHERGVLGLPAACDGRVEGHRTRGADWNPRPPA